VEDSIELGLELLDRPSSSHFLEFRSTMARWKSCCERRRSANARVAGRCTLALGSKNERLRYQRGTQPSSALTSSKDLRYTIEKPTTAGNDYRGVKSTMIWMVPIQAHQIDGRSHRYGKFTCWVGVGCWGGFWVGGFICRAKDPFIAVSRGRSSFGRVESMAISRRFY